MLGRRWGSQERELRERLGVSLQESRLTEKLSVYETLELFRSFYERGRSPEQLLADLSLEEKRDARVGKLSGGQRQRLAVACALAGDPEILFLDEPTTGLDPQSRLQLWERIAAYKAAGRTVLLTTHYMEEAERLCDRVAIVDHGRIIALGTPARARRGPQGAALRGVLDRASGRRRRASPSSPASASAAAATARWFVGSASLAETVPVAPRRAREGGRAARVALDAPLDARGRVHLADRAASSAMSSPAGTASRDE